MSKISVLWRRLAGTSWYATLTTVLAAVSALLGSLYAPEIGQSFPLHFGPYQGISYRAGFFWLTLVLFAILFFERQRHDDDARARLENITASIQTLIETLPPRAFRSQFARHSESFLQALSTVMPRQLAGEVGPDQLAKFIRSLLHAIATLALVYDDQPSATYSANIMLFVETNALGEPFTASVRDVLKFVAPGTDLRQLRGALVLRQDLSTSTGAELPDPDAAVPVIALPVPRTIKIGTRLALLPGAPNAFAGEQGIDGYADSWTLAQWCAEKGDFPPSVQEEVRNYFDGGPGGGIRSFISRRLTVEGRSIGVLNLHANRTNILGPAVERRETFHAMLTPFLVELGLAVNRLRDLERRS